MKELFIKIKTVLEGIGFSQAEKGAKGVGQAAQQAGSRLENFRAKLQGCIVQSGALGGLLAGGVSAALNGLASLLGSAVRSVGSLANGFVAGVKSVADFAGRMSDLSAQTGQSVGDTLLLTQAFRNAGLGGEAVGQTLNLLQRALAGVNEEGQPTKAVFDRLGLSQQKLKRMSAVDALQEIGKAMAKLPGDAERTQAAFDLFGRSGGRMMALLKDSGAFDTARTQLGWLAENLKSSTEDLDAFSDALGSMDLKSLQFFAGFTKGLSGDLRDAADSLNKIDLSKPGEDLGLMARGAADLARELADAAKSAASVAPAPVQQWAAIGARTGFMVSPGGATAMGLVALTGFLKNRGKQASAMEQYDREQMAKPQPMDGATGPVLGPEYNPEAQAAAQAAAALRDKKEALETEIKLAEAVAAGNEEEATRLRWIKAYNKALAETEGDEYLSRRAANASVASQQQASAKKKEAEAAKREELALELQLAEARATGNTEEEKRLKWMREYNRLLEEGRAAGMGDDAYNLAIRGANAKAAAEKTDKTDPRWTQSAIQVEAGSLTQSVARLIGNTTKPADKTAEVAANTKRIADRQEALIALIERQEVDTFAL